MDKQKRLKQKREIRKLNNSLSCPLDWYVYVAGMGLWLRSYRLLLIGVLIIDRDKRIERSLRRIKREKRGIVNKEIRGYRIAYLAYRIEQLIDVHSDIQT